VERPRQKERVMDTEQEGIKAIIALQAMAGIVESEEDAKAGWANMSKYEQDITLSAYRMFCSQEE
jgi:hypothetical protein